MVEQIHWTHKTVRGRTIKYSLTKWQQMALQTGQKKDFFSSWVLQHCVQLNRHSELVHAAQTFTLVSVWQARLTFSFFFVTFYQCTLNFAFWLSFSEWITLPHFYFFKSKNTRNISENENMHTVCMLFFVTYIHKIRFLHIFKTVTGYC